MNYGLAHWPRVDTAGEAWLGTLIVLVGIHVVVIGSLLIPKELWLSVVGA